MDNGDIGNGALESGVCLRDLKNAEGAPGLRRFTINALELGIE